MYRPKTVSPPRKRVPLTTETTAACSPPCQSANATRHSHDTTATGIN
jgi:hypothetical protein